MKPQEQRCCFSVLSTLRSGSLCCAVFVLPHLGRYMVTSEMMRLFSVEGLLGCNPSLGEVMLRRGRSGRCLLEGLGTTNAQRPEAKGDFLMMSLKNVAGTVSTEVSAYWGLPEQGAYLPICLPSTKQLDQS